MKKLMAMLLALVMALSCVGAVAEETGFGMTVAGKITVDPEQVAALAPMVGLDEEALPIVNLVLSVVNNLGARAVIGGNGMQFDVLLKDGTIATIAGTATEEGLAVVSSLIPSYVVTVSAETIQQLMQQVQDMVPAMDSEAIMNALMTHVGAFMETFSQKVGEPEMGEYTFEDTVFNTKIPLNMTSKELAYEVVKMAKGILEDENFGALLTALQEKAGAAMELPNLDEALAAIEEKDEADMPVLDAAMYMIADEEGNTASDMYFAASLDKEEESVSISGGLVNGNGYLHVNALNQTQIDGCVVPGEDGVKISLKALLQGMYLGLDETIAMTDEGLRSDTEVFFMNAEKPLVVLNAAMVPGGEITASFDAEDKTVISVEEIMADEEGTAVNGLMMDLMTNGLNGVLANAGAQMPDEIGALMTLLTSSQEADAEAVAQ